MRWKVYLALIFLLQIGVTYDIFFRRFHEANIVIILHTFVFYFAVLGLFAYIFNKHLFTKFFWKYFFWLNIILYFFIILYALFPQVSSLHFLSVFFYKTRITYVARLTGALLGPILFLPLFYANYQLSQGKFYITKEKPKKVTKVSEQVKSFKWGMIQIALWGYSSVITFFFFLISFLSVSGSNKISEQTDFTVTFIISIIFAPIFIFWLWVVVRYKRYKWNWLRTTLAANSLLLSGITVFGAFAQQSNQNSSGVDIAGILQLFILLLSLYIFGRDQFMTGKIFTD